MSNPNGFRSQGVYQGVSLRQYGGTVQIASSGASTFDTAKKIALLYI